MFTENGRGADEPENGEGHKLKFTACYTRIEAGYMGQLLEWPEVITEGATLGECREMLIDAAQEMADVYRDDGLAIPQPSILLEPLTVPVREAALGVRGVDDCDDGA